MSNLQKALAIFDARDAGAIRTSAGWLFKSDIRRDPRLADVVTREAFLAPAVRVHELED